MCQSFLHYVCAFQHGCLVVRMPSEAIISLCIAALLPCGLNAFVSNHILMYCSIVALWFGGTTHHFVILQAKRGRGHTDSDGAWFARTFGEGSFSYSRKVIVQDTSKHCKIEVEKH